MALLQMPAISLAVLGLIKAATVSNNRSSILWRALVIPFIPFFLLGFFNDVLIIIGQLCAMQALSTFNFFSFLGETEEEQSLALQMTKVFSSSVLQLLFQLHVLLAFTPWRSVLPTQVLSILASLLVIVKVATQLVVFNGGRRKSKGKNYCQQFQYFLAHQFDFLKHLIKLFPLMLVNVIFNIGTIVLCFLELDTFLTICAIAGALFLHVLLLQTLPFLSKLEMGKTLLRIGNNTGDKELRKSVLTSLVLSWTNLFIVSCSLVKGKFELAFTVFLLQVNFHFLSNHFTLLHYIQVLRFFVNSSLLLYILATSWGSNPTIFGIAIGVLIATGILSIILLHKYSLFKVSINATNAKKSEDNIYPQHVKHN